MSGPNSSWIDPSDIQDNKVLAALGYILFLIPLLLAKDSKFAKYHANQGLLLLLACIAVNFVLGSIPFIGILLLPLANLVVFVFAIMGIVRSVNGQTLPLPFIGRFTLIK